MKHFRLVLAVVALATLNFPLFSQTFTFCLSPGLTFSGRDDQAYQASNQLAPVEGFPAPGLMAEIGLRFADRLGIGLRLMDLERGTENGFTNAGIQTSLFLRHTPLLGQVKWHLWPVVDGQKWNLALHAAGGVVLEHRIRRFSSFSNGIQTNLTERQEPFAQTDGAIGFGAELQYRANGVALVKLGIEEIFLFRSGLPTYPFLSLGVEVEFGRRSARSEGKSTKDSPAKPGKTPSSEGKPGTGEGKKVGP